MMLIHIYSSSVGLPNKLHKLQSAYIQTDLYNAQNIYYKSIRKLYIYFRRKAFPRSVGIYGWKLEQLLRNLAKHPRCVLLKKYI